MKAWAPAQTGCLCPSTALSDVLPSNICCTSASDRLGSQKGYPQRRWFKITPLTKRALLFSHSSLPAALTHGHWQQQTQGICAHRLQGQQASWTSAAAGALHPPSPPAQPTSIPASLWCLVLPSYNQRSREAHPGTCQPCPVQPHVLAPSMQDRASNRYLRD